MKYSELLSWVANLVSFLLFIYLTLKAYLSPCFNIYDTFLSLGTIMLSIFAQFMAVVLKNT